MFSIFGLDAFSKRDAVYNIEDFGKCYSFNTGNLMFSYGLRRIADLHHQPVSWGAKKALINKSTQGLIMPMANQLGAHFDFGKQGPSLDGIEVPVVAIGLGAQFPTDKIDHSKIPDGTVEWLNKLAERSPEKNIGVRGEVTFSVLEKLGLSDSVEVLGCPSHFINRSKTLGNEIKKKIDSTPLSKKLRKISVVAGNPYLAEFSEVEKKFISWVDNYGADYVVQHPKPLIELANSWPVSDDALGVVIKRWFDNMSGPSVSEWFDLKSSLYISVPQWLLDFSKKELVVGTRIHGIQAALQSGTPGLCLYVDSRTKELCETMHVPHASARDFARGISLEDAFDIVSNWDWNSYDDNREYLAEKTKNFLAKNGVEWI